MASSATRGGKAPLAALLSHPELRGYAIRLLGSAQDADDLLQSLAERLLTGGRAPDDAQRYLKRSIRNAAVDHFRAASTRERLEACASITFEKEPVSGSVEDLAAASCLSNTLQALPVLTREIFRLHHLEGLSQQRVAAQLRVHLSSVEKHLAKARRACLATLAEGG